MHCKYNNVSTVYKLISSILCSPWYQSKIYQNLCRTYTIPTNCQITPGAPPEQPKLLTQITSKIVIFWQHMVTFTYPFWRDILWYPIRCCLGSVRKKIVCGHKYVRLYTYVETIWRSIVGFILAWYNYITNYKVIGVR